jgi:hypothetical protein
MISPAHHHVTTHYRVEISGWDKNQAFFVEKSELAWSEQSGKQVALHSAIPDGAIIFLKLLQPLRMDRAHPVAYEAELVGVTQHGLHQFRLHSVSPRTGGHDSHSGSPN